MVLQVSHNNVVEPKTVFLLSVWNMEEISTFSLKPKGMKPNTNVVQRYTEILDRVNSFKAKRIGKLRRWQVLVFVAALALTALAS